ncbi:DUF1059 domain-containing protein [Candidatus Bathyarchaeota archaeon]|nr:DUF1059 domain-containing protein [Candidatus Bathyarchaeota archaeon]
MVQIMCPDCGKTFQGKTEDEVKAKAKKHKEEHHKD